MKKLMTALALGALIATSVVPADAMAQAWSERNRQDDRRDNDRRDNNRRDNDRRDNDRRADNWRGRDNDRRGPPVQRWRGWHGDRDIRHFDRYDRAKWRQGKWWRGRHNGRDGWWWIVGSLFYPYGSRIASIPDPYVPPVILASGRPGRSSWYYCGSPSGYYPYVQSCRMPWRAVVQW